MNFFQEFILGISLAISVGPLFIAALQIVANYGIFAGFKFFLGSWVTDVVFILFALFGFQQVIGLSIFKLVLGFLGTFLLFYLSYKSFQVKKHTEIQKVKKSNFFIQGFILHISNPLAIVFWFSIFGALQGAEPIKFTDALFIMSGICSTQIILLLIFGFIEKFKNKSTFLNWLNIISGILFFLLGVQALFSLVGLL